MRGQGAFSWDIAHWPPPGVNIRRSSDQLSSFGIRKGIESAVEGVGRLESDNSLSRRGRDERRKRRKRRKRIKTILYMNKEWERKSNNELEGKMGETNN